VSSLSRKQALGPMSRRRSYVAAQLLPLAGCAAEKGAMGAQLVVLGGVEPGAVLSLEHRETRGDLALRVHLDGGRLGRHAADAPR